jgi:16S rRNA processing protein RimM
MPRKRRPEVESAARPSGETLAVGRIVRPHGVRGGLLFDAYSELVSVLVPDAHVFVGETKQLATVIGVRKHGKRYLLELKGCTSLEAAEVWRSAEVSVAVENAPALPAGTYFHWQILGLTVITDEGVVLGQVAEILPTGANDVYLVRGEREILLPATQEVVLQIDPAAGQMIVHLLPGLAD